ncbi:NAD-dependent epimerase/dehydratase family protein [Gammaproteobacteria bacterium]|nr:NAD-dependent epimerase/dehydratase family protein [Gammaproteobacteria bacterium]MDB9841988.1 NAD-dependent epimerase/dehydratase family protein [Gammaproteobacteria bacterium]
MGKLINLKNKKLIVFGGSGFLGSFIVRRALEMGMKVTSVSSRRRSCDLDSHENLETHFFDILHEPFGIIAKNNFDYVVNCIGYIDHSSFNEDTNIIDTHFLGLMKIIKNLKRSKIKKFINIGSSDEYGKIDSSAAEWQREEPHTPYAFSKAASSHFIQMLYRNIDFPGITLRPFLVYGPFQSKERLIPYVIDSCLQNRNFDVTEGSQLRDFLYISDFVDAVFSSFLSDKKSNGKIFNIGSGNAISIQELVAIIQSKCNGGSPRFGGKKLHKKESDKIVASIDIANHFLDWSPKINISDGLDLTIDSFCNE